MTLDGCRNEIDIAVRHDTAMRRDTAMRHDTIQQ